MPQGRPGPSTVVLTETKASQLPFSRWRPGRLELDTPDWSPCVPIRRDVHCQCYSAGTPGRAASPPVILTQVVLVGTTHPLLQSLLHAALTRARGAHEAHGPTGLLPGFPLTGTHELQASKEQHPPMMAAFTARREAMTVKAETMAKARRFWLSCMLAS